LGEGIALLLDFPSLSIQTIHRFNKEYAAYLFKTATGYEMQVQMQQGNMYVANYEKLQFREPSASLVACALVVSRATRFESPP
jgi:hypothetical protein